MRVALEAVRTRSANEAGWWIRGTSERRDCCGGLVRDPAPTFGTLFCALGQMLLRPLRDHRSQRGNAEFGRFLDGPLHAIEFVDGDDERDGQRGIGLNLGDQVEADLVLGEHRSHLGVKDVAAGNHIRLHARLRAQNTRHVRGLRAHNRWP